MQYRVSALIQFTVTTDAPSEADPEEWADVDADEELDAKTNEMCQKLEAMGITVGSIESTEPL